MNGGTRHRKLIIVIGGNGFLGRHFSIHAASRGATATIVSPNPDGQFLQQHAPTLTSLSLNSFEGDNGNSLIRDARAVIFMAATSVPATYAHEPWREIRANVDPAFQLFNRIASVNSKARLIFLSSGGTLYGSGHRSPIRESESLRPISPYALHKLMLEESLAFLARTCGLRYSIMRLSNPVGRWQRNPSQGIVGVALRAALRDEVVTIFGDGSQVRDYVDADDVAEALYLAAVDSSDSSYVLNVGSGRGHTIRELFDVVENITGKTLSVRYGEARAVDVDYNVLDCSLVSQVLGWQATTPLERSIEKTRRALIRS